MELTLPSDTYFVWSAHDRADAEDLINFTATWKQRLKCVQFGHDAPYGPEVDGR